MPIGWITAGANLLGGILGADAASEGAAAQSDAARYSADKQLEAAKLAAEEARFKPYGVTSGFGRGFFDTEKKTAGYALDPRLAAFRDSLYGQAEATQRQLGALDPQEQAARYMQQQQGLLAQGRLQEDIAARQAALASGRIGLGVSAGMFGGNGVVNPDDYARMLARAQADAGIAAQADQYGQNYIDKLIARQAGLFTSGTGVEQLGQSAMTMGADIGNRAAVSGAEAGRNIMAGAKGAGEAMLSGAKEGAQYTLAGGLSNARMLQKAGDSFGGLFSKPKPL